MQNASEQPQSASNGSSNTKLPFCIPVRSETAAAYWLAYHHGWTDSRLYEVVKIAKNSPPDAFAGFRATVDDFGSLVRVGGCAA